MTDQAFHSISTTYLSAATIYARTLNASTLTGEGSGISNLQYSNFYSDPSNTIPTSAYQAFSIPWNAMQNYGGINIVYGNWYHSGVIIPSTLSSVGIIKTPVIEACNLNGASLYAWNATICSLRAIVVSTTYISANTLRAKTTYIDTNYSEKSYTTSAFIQSLSTATFNVVNFGVTNINAKYGSFSTLSTTSWTTGSITVSSMNMLDQGRNAYSPITLSSGTLFTNGSSIYTNTITGSELASTTTQLTIQTSATSNALSNNGRLVLYSTITGLGSLGYLSSIVQPQIVYYGVKGALAVNNVSPGYLFPGTVPSQPTFTVGSNTIQGYPDNTLSYYRIPRASVCLRLTGRLDTLPNATNTLSTILYRNGSPTSIGIGWNSGSSNTQIYSTTPLALSLGDSISIYYSYTGGTGNTSRNLSLQVEYV